MSIEPLHLIGVLFLELSRERECSCFIGMLCSNELPVGAFDIQNAYLQAPSLGRHFVFGTEFGLEKVSKHAIIVVLFMAINRLELITRDMSAAPWNMLTSHHAKLTLMFCFDQH